MFESESGINIFWKNPGEKTMSQYPKILLKMNNFLNDFLHYFENVIDPLVGKSEVQKNKSANNKEANQFYSSPDCMNIRASVRKNDNVRRNPAP